MHQVGKRDIQIHVKVIELGNINDMRVIGEPEDLRELSYLAVEFRVKDQPITRRKLKIMFEGLYEGTLHKLRAAGALRAGE